MQLNQVSSVRSKSRHTNQARTIELGNNQSTNNTNSSMIDNNNNTQTINAKKTGPKDKKLANNFMNIPNRSNRSGAVGNEQ